MMTPHYNLPQISIMSTYVVLTSTIYLVKNQNLIIIRSFNCIESIGFAMWAY